ncbi:MAG: carbamoyltransferase HypF [Rhodopseudomonas sp.]|uniref:carbamoyltransferase HypF n=1 Tax=Rhodopseudomonas sp. TaxID=1078 RepID=UPI00179A7756|nr:carbamoyltransferase HypF [Rhodopseudomonas sp.]NVN85483.1 carbamoyltransferase HypF [Rhodopseudomonas sp.]
MTLARPIATRQRIRVRGTVQGVGFRPFVHRLAQRFALGGFVGNDADGVLIEIEGARVAEFVPALRREAPPLARIEAVETFELASRGETRFAIAPSVAGKVTTQIAADAATCEHCLDELFDPASRFHLYPFVNCTHCGPRYTLTRRLPYDRANTSMAAFAMCADCAADYRDPANRRFHAEPIACSRCGPQLSAGIDAIVAALRGGQIVAIKSLGGFQLLCDAHNETAVARLRAQKCRDAKPFAVMIASLASLDSIAEADAQERELLHSVARPVVLLTSRRKLAPSVAPGLSRLGVMLPYTPLHHLLFHAAMGQPDGRGWQNDPCDLVLVATSANPGGEPLVIDDDDARRRLSGIADLVVTHDRAIVIRADDSVASVVAGAPMLIRRARGYAPAPIRLAREMPPLLALGGHLKSTVTVTRGREAFVSQHIGDLDSAESIRFFEQTVAHLLKILDVEPVAVVHDRHPDFASTRFAETLPWPAIAVQHHHAHVGAIAAEHGIDGPLLGLVLDGFGYGNHGESWGGELLLSDNAGFTRIGHLAPLPQPGGDVAAREPWRMAAAALQLIGRGDEIAGRFAARPQAAMLTQLLERKNVQLTTSAGRLFDAVAGLLGICGSQHYEGQAAMELEALVRRPTVDPSGWRIDDGVVSFAPLLERLAAPGVDPVAGAELFHGTFAAAMVDLASRIAAARDLNTVALGGGCFLNRVLVTEIGAGLRARGITPLMARAVPPNDGGLSLGQAWIAASALERADASDAMTGGQPTCV